MMRSDASPRDTRDAMTVLSAQTGSGQATDRNGNALWTAFSLINPGPRGLASEHFSYLSWRIMSWISFFLLE